jgi:hypothetical protein
MPSLANITVKKYDGTTDITYTALAASAGDKSPAQWSSSTVGNAKAFRPTLNMTSAPNGNNTARRVNFSFAYPSTVEDESGRTTITNTYRFTGEVLLPLAMPDADVQEAVYQGCNLAAAALVKESFLAGRAPT